MQLPELEERSIGLELYHFTSDEGWRGIFRSRQIMSTYRWLTDDLRISIPRVWLDSLLAHHQPFVWLIAERSHRRPETSSISPKDVRVTISPHAHVLYWPYVAEQLALPSTLDTFVIPGAVPLSACIRAERLSDGAILWSGPDRLAVPGAAAPSTRLEIPVVDPKRRQQEEIDDLAGLLLRDLFPFTDLDYPIENIVGFGRLPNADAADRLVELLSIDAAAST